mmetsp:Transcript_20335/g.30186  ORF Transcript_20335/g.30186 Transcript_20335/m.30186 type:complete len:83 (+) Transcript_20335:167-415(+)
MVELCIIIRSNYQMTLVNRSIRFPCTHQCATVASQPQPQFVAIGEDQKHSYKRKYDVGYPTKNSSFSSIGIGPFFNCHWSST